MSERPDGSAVFADAVFVDIDTQVDFVQPDGALYVPGAERLKPAFARLLEAARRHARPVIASADSHTPDDPEFEVFPPHCLAGTPGQRRVAETAHVDPLVVAVDGEGFEPGGANRTVVLEKVKFDLFSNPAADAAFEASGARTAVIFGVALDYCVRAAALGLRQRGYETYVVQDATAPVTEAGGAKARAELEAAGVRFTSTDVVTASMSAASA